MIKDDEILKKMFKSIDVEFEPPDGTKQIIYQKLFYDSNRWSCWYSSYLSWILEKFLKLVVQVWILIYIFMTIFTPTIAF